PDTSRTSVPGSTLSALPTAATLPPLNATSVTASSFWEGSTTRPPRRTRSNDIIISGVIGKGRDGGSQGSIEQILGRVSSPWLSGLIEAVNPGFRIKRKSLASPRQSPKAREMRMHARDEHPISADAIKHALARSSRHREIGIEAHAGLGYGGLHFRHVDGVAPDHQLMIARCNQIGGVSRRMSMARNGGDAGKDFALLEQPRAALVGR